MSVRFHMQCIPITANFLVSEDIHEFMLGYDWLSAQGSHWFFDLQILLLHGQEIPLQQRTSRSYISWVCARERAVVSPHTEQNVAVKVVRASVRMPRTD